MTARVGIVVWAVVLPLLLFDGGTRDRQALGGAPLVRGRILQRYDTNRNGRLDGDERQTLRRDVQEGRLERAEDVREALRELRVDQVRDARQAKAGQIREKVQDRAQSRTQPAAQVPGNIVVERDIEYGRAGDRSLKLDIIRPKNPAAPVLPVIVWIHGGGWRGGDKSSGLGRLASYAATGDYFCASVGYRLSGEATWPAQIHDCKAAIRWLRANAQQYGIDPEKIGVWGSSAGGHLVSLLGTSGDDASLEGSCGSPDQPSCVTCVVDFCGPSDLPAIDKVRDTAGKGAIGPVEQMLGGPVAQKTEAALAASPVTHISKEDPPFLIVHGTNDQTVPLEQAETLHDALSKAGVDSTLVKIIGGGHGFGGPEVDARVKAFFEKHLRGRKVEVSDEPIQQAPPPDSGPK